MQRFQVPQFITVEDKIIGGFLTAKQFAYVAAAVVLIVFIFFNFTGFLALFLSFIIGAAAAALAWGKINEIPIPLIVLHAIFYYIHPRVFIWKRSEERQTSKKSIGSGRSTDVIIKSSPKMSKSKLSELSWSLDTKTHEERKET